MKKIIAVASVVMMLVFSTVSVMAATSPTAEDYFTLTIGTSSSSTSASVEGGSITASVNPVVVGEEVTLTATAKDGYAFLSWDIDGEYEIVDGDLTDETITIIPAEDLTIDAQFVDKDGNVADDNTSDDNSSTSPKTGESAAVVVIALLAACGVATVARKRIAE